MRFLPLLILLFLAACDKDPDKRTTVPESQVTAKAVADVDAAAAEALQVRPLPTATPAGQPETPPEAQ